MRAHLFDYKIKIVHSNKLSTSDRKDIETFSEEAYKEKKHASHENMEVYKWEEKPHTLMYKLLAENLFHSKTGGLILTYYDSKLVALSGFYQSKFDLKCWVGGVRSWINKDHRFSYLLGKLIIPAQYQKAIIMGAKCFVLTFNDDTRYLAMFVQRQKETKKNNIFSHIDDFPHFYLEMEYYPKRLKIQNIYQHVLFKKIDKTYRPKFRSIEETST